MTDIDVAINAIALFAFFTTIGMFVICSATGGIVMESKGRSKFVGEVLGLIFGPIGLMICFCFPKDEIAVAKRLIEKGIKKKCSECGSLIDVNAKVCPFCSYAKVIIEQLNQIIENRRV
jgi:hypothetical protein